MKLSIFLCLLSFAAPAWCASATPSVENSNAVTFQYQAMDKKNPHDPLKKPLKERKLFYKGKGTMGLILGIVLGPVGFAGIHLLSHNKAMRDKAGTGFAIWLSAAIVGLLIWQGIESKVSLDDVLYYTLEVILQGLSN